MLALFGSGSSLKAVATGAGVATPQASDTQQIIGSLIGAALSLVGIVLFGYFLFGGFLWMTAGGDDKKVSDAKKYLRNAVIGLVIIVAAYAISQFVLSQIAGSLSPAGATK